MWQLKTTIPGRQWTDAGTFETIGDAARRINELEGTPEKHGVFFKVFVENNGTDTENLFHFHFDGKRTLYGVNRCRQLRVIQ